MVITPQLFLLWALLLTVAAGLAAWCCMRLLRINRQLLGNAAGMMQAYKKEVEQLETVWAQLNADHDTVMAIARAQPAAQAELLSELRELRAALGAKTA